VFCAQKCERPFTNIRWKNFMTKKHYPK
jgi:hypothetical protein